MRSTTLTYPSEGSITHKAFWLGIDLKDQSSFSLVKAELSYWMQFYDRRLLPAIAKLYKPEEIDANPALVTLTLKILMVRFCKIMRAGKISEKFKELAKQPQWIEKDPDEILMYILMDWPDFAKLVREGAIKMSPEKGNIDMEGFLELGLITILNVPPPPTVPAPRLAASPPSDPALVPCFDSTEPSQSEPTSSLPFSSMIPSVAQAFRSVATPPRTPPLDKSTPSLPSTPPLCTGTTEAVGALWIREPGGASETPPTAPPMDADASSSEESISRHTVLTDEKILAILRERTDSEDRSETQVPGGRLYMEGGVWCYERGTIGYYLDGYNKLVKIKRDDESDSDSQEADVQSITASPTGSGESMQVAPGASTPPRLSESRTPTPVLITEQLLELVGNRMTVKELKQWLQTKSIVLGSESNKHDLLKLLNPEQIGQLIASITSPATVGNLSKKKKVTEAPRGAPISLKPPPKVASPPHPAATTSSSRHRTTPGRTADPRPHAPVNTLYEEDKEVMADILRALHAGKAEERAWKTRLVQQLAAPNPTNIKPLYVDLKAYIPKFNPRLLAFLIQIVATQKKDDTELVNILKEATTPTILSKMDAGDLGGSVYFIASLRLWEIAPLLIDPLKVKLSLMENRHLVRATIGIWCLDLQGAATELSMALTARLGSMNHRDLTDIINIIGSHVVSEAMLDSLAPVIGMIPKLLTPAIFDSMKHAQLGNTLYALARLKFNDDAFRLAAHIDQEIIDQLSMKDLSYLFAGIYMLGPDLIARLGPMFTNTLTLEKLAQVPPGQWHCIMSYLQRLNLITPRLREDLSRILNSEKLQGMTAGDLAHLICYAESLEVTNADLASLTAAIVLNKHTRTINPETINAARRESIAVVQAKLRPPAMSSEGSASSIAPELTDQQIKIALLHPTVMSTAHLFQEKGRWYFLHNDKKYFISSNGQLEHTDFTLGHPGAPSASLAESASGTIVSKEKQSVAASELVNSVVGGSTALGAAHVGPVISAHDRRQILAALHSKDTSENSFLYEEGGIFYLARGDWRYFLEEGKLRCISGLDDVDGASSMHLPKSPWGGYNVQGLYAALTLRLEGSGTLVSPPLLLLGKQLYFYPRKYLEPSARLVPAKIAVPSSGGVVAVAVISHTSLGGRHCSGILASRTDSSYEATYLDSENNAPAAGMVSAFIAAMPNVGAVTLIHRTTPRQSYSNGCGPSLVESCANNIIGNRVSENQAVPFHSWLLARFLRARWARVTWSPTNRVVPITKNLPEAPSSRALVVFAGTPIAQPLSPASFLSMQSWDMLFVAGYSWWLGFNNLLKVREALNAAGLADMPLSIALSGEGFRQASFKLHPDRPPGGAFSELSGLKNTYDDAESFTTARTHILYVTQYFLRGVTIVSKSLEALVDFTALGCDPTLDNLKQASLTTSSLYAITSGSRMLPLALSTGLVAHTAYTEGPQAGFEQAAGIAASAALPLTVGLIYAPAGIAVSGLIGSFSVYQMISKAGALYNAGSCPTLGIYPHNNTSEARMDNNTAFIRDASPALILVGEQDTHAEVPSF